MGRCEAAACDLDEWPVTENTLSHITIDKMRETQWTVAAISPVERPCANHWVARKANYYLEE